MKKRYLKHKPKTVLLVGMGPSIGALFNETLTQEMMPDHHDEIWTINMASNVVQSDMVIWMDDLEDQEKFKPGLFSILRRKKIPVLTSKRYPEILPNSYDYPLDKVAPLMMPYLSKPYLNNGVAMGIGYAISIGVKTLKMYGCDFTYPNRNYAESGRACCEAWLMLAAIHKMDIVLPATSSLVDSIGDAGIYGYRDQPVINLPGGQKLQYANQEQLAQMPGYEAEDSSGKPVEPNHAVPGRLSGTLVRTPNGSGANPAGANGAEQVPAPAAN